jgi:hypothetical protein
MMRVAWQDSRDTSIVWASVIESSVDPDFVKAGAIPCLKIDVENTGGAVPSAGCDRPTDVGKKAFVPYHRSHRTLKGNRQKMLHAALAVTIAFVATISVGGTIVSAQVAQDSNVVIEPEASADSVSFMKLNVNLDPFTFWLPKGTRPATRLTIRSDEFLQTPSSSRSGTHARSKKRIIAGAIAGSVGGFFAGGFLGAHIEGDRCDCDDPGVRGFLIGAPIGAAAGGIFGAKFLF